MANNVVTPAGTASEHVEIALFTPISTPILRSVDPMQVVSFFKERERYELEVESKQLDLPSLEVTSYKESVDHSLLKHLAFIGCFGNVAPDVTFETLTRENIAVYL